MDEATKAHIGALMVRFNNQFARMCDGITALRATSNRAFVGSRVFRS